MGLPVMGKTDVVAWFKEACDRCREIYLNAVVEYVAEHEDEIKEKVLKGEEITTDVKIYDKLCPRCKGLWKKYTEVWVDKNVLKDALFGGDSLPRPRKKKKRRERG